MNKQIETPHTWRASGGAHILGGRIADSLAGVGRRLDSGGCAGWRHAQEDAARETEHDG